MIDYDLPFSWLDKHHTVDCTCCAVPRRAVFNFDNPRESFHIDNGHVASFMHAHVARQSVDCDGPLDRYHVTRPTILDIYDRDDDDNGNGVQDAYSFWVAQVAATLSAHADSGTLTVQASNDGERTVTWTETTDEGGRFEERELCFRATCAREQSSQRDYYAEAAGY